MTEVMLVISAFASS